jgi:hypothetical protein
MLPSLKARHSSLSGNDSIFTTSAQQPCAGIRTHSRLSMCVSPEDPSQDELNAVVCRMCEKGLKATGANATIRAINAYVH